MRLNKYIASCGFSSRRGADKIIADGNVTVNGNAVTTMGPDIDEKNDVVRIDGRRISLKTDNAYIMLNKPAGYICTCSDDRGRKTVLDLVDIDKRVFPVGRLDYDTEGLLILTSDGDFAYRCTHPKHEVSKKYLAVVEGTLDESAVQKLCGGVAIDGRKTSKAEIEVLEQSGGSIKLHITIHEGRNRQVKKMFEAVGCTVIYLKRISIGGLELGNLQPGTWRHFNENDFKLLGISEKVTE